MILEVVENEKPRLRRGTYGRRPGRVHMYRETDDPGPRPGSPDQLSVIWTESLPKPPPRPVTSTTM